MSDTHYNTNTTPLTQESLEAAWQVFQARDEAEIKAYQGWGEKMRTDPAFAKRWTATAQACQEMFGVELNPARPLLMSPATHKLVVKRVEQILETK